MNLHEEIAKVAYELYLKRGCVHGHDLDDWLEAERIVLTRHAGQEIEEPDIEVTEEIPSITIEELAEETVIEETEAPPVVEKKRAKRKTAKKTEEKPKKKVTRKKKKE